MARGFLSMGKSQSINGWFGGTGYPHFRKARIGGFSAQAASGTRKSPAWSSRPRARGLGLFHPKGGRVWCKTYFGWSENEGWPYVMPFLLMGNKTGFRPWHLDINPIFRQSRSRNENGSKLMKKRSIGVWTSSYYQLFWCEETSSNVLTHSQVSQATHMGVSKNRGTPKTTIFSIFFL
jgi:hypothetical protein